MHSALKEVSCSNADEMLEEKESDVNVMDFVETEYKSDEQEDMVKQIDPRRRSLRRQKITTFSVGSQPDVEFSSSHASRTTKKYCKKRRKKGITDLKFVGNGMEDQRELYPYAMMLKGICEEVGKFHPSEPVASEKVFKKLLPANINYPYASLLQELHQTSENKLSDALSVYDHQHQAEISHIMKSINHRISLPVDEENNAEQIGNEDFDSSFSGALLGMILKEKIESYPSEGSRSTKGIGQILSSCMSEFYEDNPLQEMRSSSLLLKLSLLSEKESQQNGIRTLETAASSTESGQEDVFDWKPSNRKAGSKIHIAGDGSLKRASLRKKKSLNKFDASPATNSSRRSKSKLSSGSNQEPQLLLQLILGRRVDCSDLQGTGKRTCKKPETRSNVLKKIRSKIKDRMKDVESKNNSHQKKRRKALSRSTEEECHKTENLMVETTEQQSLLKEYLLKPAGQEILLKSESDIPKLSTNSFLFSRLLQNFKSISENSQSEDSLNKMGESSGSNILREMLLQSCSQHNSEANNDSEDEHIDEKPFRPLEHVYVPSFQSCSDDDFVDPKDPLGDKNCEEKIENNAVPCRNILREILIGSQCSPESHYSNSCEESQDTKNVTLKEHLHLPSSEKDSSENDSTDPGSPVCEIKCEVKCEDEFLEDIFECHICHLEFSSEVDLSDHQMLFHCDEEVQAAVPACIVPHATDNVQNSLFLEKLPA